MSEHKIVRLQFKSPLHIGKGLGEAYDTADSLLHSDTISGAIMAAYCSLYGSKSLLEFANNYKVSSGFPYFADTLFLPRPNVDLNVTIEGIDEYSSKKVLKKIGYIDSTLFSRVVSSEKISVSREQLSLCKQYLHNGNANGEKILVKEVQQKVTIDREGNESVPYYFERTFFNDKAGIYFYYQVTEESEKPFESALDYLSSVGFGTDKSVGNGQFEFEIAEVELPTTATHNAVLLLSLFCPTKEDLEKVKLENSCYLLTKRGGFISGTTNDKIRHLRKRSVYMFTEGSILRTERVEGKIVNVTPMWNSSDMHDVFRDGRAYYLPINI